jgi:hypothetical protein
MIFNWAWTESVFMTQQVDFDRRGLGKTVTDDIVAQRKKRKIK